jgi:hypothetical protein
MDCNANCNTKVPTYRRYWASVPRRLVIDLHHRTTIASAFHRSDSQHLQLTTNKTTTVSFPIGWLQHCCKAKITIMLWSIYWVDQPAYPLSDWYLCFKVGNRPSQKFYQGGNKYRSLWMLYDVSLLYNEVFIFWCCQIVTLCLVDSICRLFLSENSLQFATCNYLFQ